MGFALDPPVAAKVRTYRTKPVGPTSVALLEPAGYVKVIVLGFIGYHEGAPGTIVMLEDGSLRNASLADIVMPDRPEYKQLFAEYVLTENETKGGQA